MSGIGKVPLVSLAVNGSYQTAPSMRSWVRASSS